jgi:predicted transcriptional regulator of viral defense system
MGPEVTKMDSVAELLRERGSLRPRDLAGLGVPSNYLDRLHRRGLADKVARGLYASPDADVGEHHSLAEAAHLVPNGVVCLLSALRFHGLTTQAPREVWLALPNKAWSPRVRGPRLKIVRFSGAALSEMVEEHEIEKVAVRVYSPAKTVADCFKYRNKIGLDVALEALRDCWKLRKATMDELWRAATICRMENVMRPYLESIV